MAFFSAQAGLIYNILRMSHLMKSLSKVKKSDGKME